MMLVFYIAVLFTFILKISGKPQYEITNSDPFAIALDQIVRNTRLQLQTSIAMEQLLKDCTQSDACGFGAECVLSTDEKNINCQCRDGFDRTNNGKQCSRIEEEQSTESPLARVQQGIRHLQEMEKAEAFMDNVNNL